MLESNALSENPKIHWLRGYFCLDKNGRKWKIEGHVLRPMVLKKRRIQVGATEDKYSMLYVREQYANHQSITDIGVVAVKSDIKVGYGLVLIFGVLCKQVHLGTPVRCTWLTLTQACTSRQVYL
jgi:hypothetical protein